MLGVAYRLRNVVYHYGTVRIPVVHGGQRLVAFLTRCVPYLEFDRSGFVECDGLGEESGADGGLSVVIELVLTGIRGYLGEDIGLQKMAYFHKAQDQ